MTKLSASQRVILSAAAQHEMGLARAPKTLPAAGRNAVFRSMIKTNLLTKINAPREHVGLGWRQDDDGTWMVARITDERLRAIGIDPNEGDAGAGDLDCSGLEGSVPDTAPTGADAAAEGDAPTGEAEPAQVAPTPAPRASLRDAPAALLSAWDASPAQDATDTRSAAPSRLCAPPSPASHGRARSRSRCWPCSVVRRARSSRRSPRLGLGAATRSAASWPASRRRATLSR